MMEPVLHHPETRQAFTITAAPVEALQAIVAGDFDGAETGPDDNPLVTQAIAARLLKERAQ